MDHEHDTAAPPTITFLFDGLFFLCFDEEAKECQIGVLTTAPGHRLSITVTKRTGDEETAYTTALNSAVARLAGHISLDIEGAAAPGVTRYGYGDGTPITREDRDAHPENFKWVIDFENSEMHGKELPKVEGILSPVLHMGVGEFYTAKVSEHKQIRTRGNAAHKTFGYVAELIGSRITLDRPGRAILKAGETTWVLPIETGSTYVVHLKYLRPEHAEHRHEGITTESPRLSTHSDLHFYYHALDVPATERFDFEPVLRNRVVKPMFGAPPLICYATTGSKTKQVP